MRQIAAAIALRLPASALALLLLVFWNSSPARAQSWLRQATWELSPTEYDGTFASSVSGRLWQATSWDGMPNDPVIGSWESVRLWESSDPGRLDALSEGGLPAPAPRPETGPWDTSFFSWPGPATNQAEGSASPPAAAGPALNAATGPKATASPPEQSEASLVAPAPRPLSAESPSAPEVPASSKKPASPESNGTTTKAAESPAADKKTTPKNASPATEGSAAREKNSSQDSAEEVPAEEAKVDVEPPSTSWFAWPPVLEHWDARLKAGMDGTAGNNQRLTTRLGLDVDHKDPRFVWSSQLDYVVTTSAGQQIENEAIWDGRFERLTKDSPTGWFVHSNVEYDRFTAFDVRVTLDGGLSYYFVRDADLSFKGRMAGGTSREFGIPGAEYVPEFSYGLEMQWKPHKRYELKAKTDVFSDVRDFSDFRATTRATWRVRVDSADRVSLQFELLNRYDSTPNGKKKYDLTYSVQLVWDL